jgi:hypothetical protein
VDVYTSTFPDSSDWPYTRYFLQRAFDTGFRLEKQHIVLWEAFDAAHRRARFDFTMEVPMIRMVNYVSDKSFA